MHVHTNTTFYKGAQNTFSQSQTYIKSLTHTCTLTNATIGKGAQNTVNHKLTQKA